MDMIKIDENYQNWLKEVSKQFPRADKAILPQVGAKLQMENLTECCEEKIH